MDAPVVTIKQGQLKGCVSTDIDGGRIISFLGVPYAKPPVGELRFKAPQSAEPWVGTLDATKEGNMCYSRDLFRGVLEGSEDCLNLNIFTKALPTSSTPLKAVMIWIHGGAFITGSNRTAMYGPDFLLTQDIVLVSINYRLGALGFLTSDDISLEVPGNAGLKDQALAIKWVHENISSFNGDPNNVTIFGESAGAGSVHYQVLSSTTRGLFHKAILQSGCALNHWARGQNVILPLAKQLGHDVNNEREALDILKKTPVEALHEAQEKLDKAKLPSQKGYFAPVVEKPNETAFITEDPIEIIRSGNYNQVPLIFGYTTREGLLLAVIESFAEKSGEPVKKKPPNLEDALSWQLGIERGSELSQQVCRKLGQTYLKGPNIADDVYVLSTDSLFLAGIMASIKNHLNTAQTPIYLYRMSLDAGLNIVKFITKLNLPGACHGDDVGYLFRAVVTPKIEPGSVEDISFRRFVTLWTNFAKYGNPTPNEKELGITWEPVKEETISFIDIGEKLTTGVNPEQERMELWRYIYGLSSTTANFL